MNTSKQKWPDMLGAPLRDKTYGATTLVSSFSHQDFDGEWYRQENGDGKYQRVLLLFPKALEGRAPAVAVPFYFPEAMIGYHPENDSDDLSRYANISMMLHLVRRGYIVASADAYHLTYIESDKARGDFSRWQDAADALRRDHPHYRGMGKLFDDTRLVIDLLESDPRVDSEHIGIAGLYATDESYEIMCRAEGYAKDDGRLRFINHATGHRPPLWALEAGYEFLDMWLKQ